jgi:hypothetical protein
MSASSVDRTVPPNELSEASIRRCESCGGPPPGTLWLYEFGTARRHTYDEIRRGVTPDEVRQGLTPLGREELFLCHRCFRKLWRHAIWGRVRERRGPVSAILAITLASMIGLPRLLPPELRWLSFPLAAAVVGILPFLLRLLLRQSQTQLEVAFSARRAELALRHDVRAEALLVRAIPANQ